MWVYHDDDTVTCLVSNRTVLDGATRYVCQGWIGAGERSAHAHDRSGDQLNWHHAGSGKEPATYNGQNGTGWLVGLYADDGNLARDTIATDGGSTGDDLLLATTVVTFSDSVKLFDAVNVDIDQGRKVYTVVFNSPAVTSATHYVALTNGTELFLVDTNVYKAGTAVAANWQPLADPTNGNPAITTGPFTITNDSSITWLWQTNYYLATYTNGNGNVSTNGWIPAGSKVQISAQPGPNARFVEWRGTVATTSVNPLDLVMLQPHSSRASSKTCSSRPWERPTTGCRSSSPATTCTKTPTTSTWTAR